MGRKEGLQRADACVAWGGRWAGVKVLGREAGGEWVRYARRKKGVAVYGAAVEREVAQRQCKLQPPRQCHDWLLESPEEMSAALRRAPSTVASEGLRSLHLRNSSKRGMQRRSASSLRFVAAS